jgi:cell division protein FtsB
MGTVLSIPEKHRRLVFAGVAVIVLLSIFAVFGSRGLIQLRDLQEKQGEAEALAFQLEQENERLRQHLHRIEHDDAYLERVVRERLGWIKEGEFVFRVPLDRVDPETR